MDNKQQQKLYNLLLKTNDTYIKHIATSLYFRLCREENIKIDDSIIDYLNSLHPNSKLVLERYFGIGCEPFNTNKEIADSMHISSSRVQQIVQCKGYNRITFLLDKNNVSEYKKILNNLIFMRNNGINNQN